MSAKAAPTSLSVMTPSPSLSNSWKDFSSTTRWETDIRALKSVARTRDLCAACCSCLEITPSPSVSTFSMISFRTSTAFSPVTFAFSKQASTSWADTTPSRSKSMSSKLVFTRLLAVVEMASADCLCAGGPKELRRARRPLACAAANSSLEMKPSPSASRSSKQTSGSSEQGLSASPASWAPTLATAPETISEIFGSKLCQTRCSNKVPSVDSLDCGPATFGECCASSSTSVTRFATSRMEARRSFASASKTLLVSNSRRRFAAAISSLATPRFSAASSVRRSRGSSWSSIASASSSWAVARALARLSAAFDSSSAGASASAGCSGAFFSAAGAGSAFTGAAPGDTSGDGMGGEAGGDGHSPFFWTAVGRTKIPCSGSHVKYTSPLTLPLFFPDFFSNSTPSQSPGANFVGPAKRTMPLSS
mmetsp:Transcript_65419/g.153997  ORF Transcript_65419/g.153997 Transcript_65419/m.153997 type:complete len:421 (+) Transcript_65419:72-1334(+)